MKKNFFLLVFLLPAVLQAQMSVDMLFTKMQYAVVTLKTAQYSFSKNERLNGVMRKGNIETKIQMHPLKVYLKVTAPEDDAGTEILYVEGERGGECLVNPNMVPFNVNLSPLSEKIIGKEHHTLFQTGFEYIKTILVSMKKEYQDKIDEYCKLTEITWNSKPMYKLEINFPEFKYVDYTVQAGEDLIKIARKKYISEYMIKEKNGLKSYDAVKAGQVIKIPNVYAKKAIFYFDKTNFLPVFQQMHDDKGLFEEYTFYNLKLNPTFPAGEFTKHFDGYDF